jgi:hypothetical protein
VLDAREDVDLRKTRLSAPRARYFIRQRTTLRSLVSDWHDMTLDERRRLLLLVFKDVVVDGKGSLNSCRTITGSRTWGCVDQKAGTT